MSSRHASIGLYTIKFYKHGNWKYVHIDDRLPLNAAREPKYAHCKNESETWVMLLEKAYAKLHGCYENLASGWIDYGLRDLTGGAPMKMKFKDKRYARMLLRNDGVEMFELLRTSHKSGALVGCSFNTNESDETRHRDSGLGILRGHAYGILRIVERTVKHEDDDDDEMLRLLQLRNPWGMKEWMGDFSDGDTIWDDYPEIKRELVGKDGFSNDGVFWMSWYDFVSEFNQVFVCEDRDHKTWHGTRFEGTSYYLLLLFEHDVIIVRTRCTLISYIKTTQVRGTRKYPTLVQVDVHDIKRFLRILSTHFKWTSPHPSRLSYFNETYVKLELSRFFEKTIHTYIHRFVGSIV